MSLSVQLVPSTTTTYLHEQFDAQSDALPENDEYDEENDGDDGGDNGVNQKGFFGVVSNFE